LLLGGAAAAGLLGGLSCRLALAGDAAGDASALPTAEL
jgi:hypothetical protein